MDNINNYKLVLIGDTGVGKSSLLFWFLHNKVTDSVCPTIGAAFSIKGITIANKKIKLNIWDTAGQERYRSIAKMYYKYTLGCICVFDVTSKQSFDNLHMWINDYQQNNNIDNPLLIIVANKCDLDKQLWQVSEREIKDLIDKHNCECIYTDCVYGTNVGEPFFKLAEKISNNPTILKSNSNDKNIINISNQKMVHKKCKC